MKTFLLLLLCMIIFKSAIINAQGSCVSFPGTAYNRCESGSAPTNLDNISDALTVEAWIYLTQGNDVGQDIAGVVSHSNGVVISYALFLSTQSSGSAPMFEISADGTYSTEKFIIGSGLSLNTWYHIAAVYDGGTSTDNMRIYVNGNLSAQGTSLASGIYSQAVPFRVGDRGTDQSVDHPFQGKIDEVRVSNISRYTSNFTKPSAPFTSDANTLALYHFDESSGNAIDSGPYGYDLTLYSASFTASDAPMPVELTSFTANEIENTVELNWRTATEVNNYGFEIERRNPLLAPFQGGETKAWKKIGFVKGSGNSNSEKDYSFEDAGLVSGKAEYRLKQIDNDGSFKYSNIVETSFMKPTKYELYQNYPNPFNPTTTIQYAIPKAGYVTLKIYNELGKEVSTLVDGFQQADNYKAVFNATRTMNNTQLASGIYYYSIRTDNFYQVKKLILLK